MRGTEEISAQASAPDPRYFAGMGRVVALMVVVVALAGAGGRVSASAPKPRVLFDDFSYASQR